MWKNRISLGFKMDKGRLGVRNWDFSGHHEQVFQPASDVSISQGAASHRQSPFLKMSTYQDRSSGITESNTEIPSPMSYGWVPHRNFLSAAKSNLGPMKSHQANLEITSIPSLMPSIDNTSNNDQLDSKPMKGKKKRQPSAKEAKQAATKISKLDQPKKQPSTPKKKKTGSVSIGTREKRNLDVIAEGVTFDFSGVPSPICTCTSVPRQCYRWGAGGWQSSCCTTIISEYPLPMSTSRPGSRLAGRKMSNGAYGKLLQRLAVEGHDLSSAVDLKNHWARHGTNKFVTIR